MPANPLRDILKEIPAGVTVFGNRCLHPDFTDTPKNEKRRLRLLNAHKERMERAKSLKPKEPQC